MRSKLKQVSEEIDRMLAAESLPSKVLYAGLADAVRAYPQLGGKRLRPALVLWCCGLVGGDVSRARCAALAVELYHNWTLVHDDIIDRDATRRGQPACHCLATASSAALFPGAPEAAAEFGRNMAMLAGDIQQSWAIDALLRSRADGVPSDVVLAIAARLTGHVTPALISGEALDMVYSRRQDVQCRELEKMLELKTAVLLEFAAQAGVLIGLSSPDFERSEVRAAGAFAKAAGLAFQLRDDLLGVFGDEATLGKPVGSDAREGKRTPLLADALEHSDAENRRDLLRLWGRVDLDAADLAKVRRIIRASGADLRIRERARELVEEAVARLAGFASTSYRDALEQWARFALERSH